MNEQEWLVCDDPQAMLRYLRVFGSMGLSPLISDHKLKLFRKALWGDKYPPHGYKTEENIIWLQDWFAVSDQDELSDYCNILRDIVGNPFRDLGLKWGMHWRNLGERCLYYLHSREMKSQKNGPDYPDEEWIEVPWLTPTVTSLAQGIYDRQEWDLMPELGDALEEAGCTNEEILRHLRRMERCPECLGSGLLTYQTCTDCGRQCDNQVFLGTGWIPLRGPHVRGCWVIDLLTGRE